MPRPRAGVRGLDVSPRKMETHALDKENAIATGKLFPDAIESIESIAYHGTTCAYSETIEADGFVHGVRPYELDFLTTMADLVRTSNGNLAAELDGEAANPVRLSFTTKWLTALEYALKARGGQSLGRLRLAASMIDSVPEDISSLLKDIDSQDVCVYAVDLSAVDPTAIETAGAVRWVSTSVTPDLIVAKLVIPRGTDYAEFEAMKPPSLGDIYAQKIAGKHGG